MSIREIKDKYRKEYNNDFVDFIEHWENDLKEFATLEYYNYNHSDETKENIHNFIFELKGEKNLIQKIQKVEVIINTYNEGTINFGVIHFGSIYLTIIGTD